MDAPPGKKEPEKGIGEVSSLFSEIGAGWKRPIPLVGGSGPHCGRTARDPMATKMTTKFTFERFYFGKSTGWVSTFS